MMLAIYAFVVFCYLFYLLVCSCLCFMFVWVTLAADLTIILSHSVS